MQQTLPHRRAAAAATTTLPLTRILAISRVSLTTRMPVYFVQHTTPHPKCTHLHTFAMSFLTSCLSNPAPCRPRPDTDSLLTQYLAGSQARRQVAVNKEQRPTARCTSPTTTTSTTFRGRQASPTLSQEHVGAFRSLSPVCRGLLDVADMAGESPELAASVGRSIKALPILRPASPEGPAGRFRKPPLASPTLNSVQEEAGNS